MGRMDAKCNVLIIIISRYCGGGAVLDSVQAMALPTPACMRGATAWRGETGEGNGYV